MPSRQKLPEWVPGTSVTAAAFFGLGITGTGYLPLHKGKRTHNKPHTVPHGVHTQKQVTIKQSPVSRLNSCFVLWDLAGLARVS